MKTERGLSGIYFRVKSERGNYYNAVFEDLTEKQQSDVMQGRDEEWLKSLAKQLADTLNTIGEQLDLKREE